MEERDIVLAKPQMLEAPAQLRGLDKEIGDDDNQGPLPNRFGQLVQGGHQTRLALGFELFHEVEQGGEMRRIAARRQLRDNALGDRVQSDGVSLLDREVAEGRAKLQGVFEFGDAFRAKAHRAARVDDEAATQVCVRLELLHIEPIAAAVRSPVEPPQVVARHVLAVLGELDA